MFKRMVALTKKFQRMKLTLLINATGKQKIHGNNAAGNDVCIAANYMTEHMTGYMAFDKNISRTGEHERN